MPASRKKKIFIILIFFAALSAAYFFYFRYQVYHSKGSYKAIKIFKIEKGERNGSIAGRLIKESLIANKLQFYYYLKTHDLINKILPGDYEIGGNMTIPEIASIITEEQNKFLKVTFPEGWDSKKIAERLSANGFFGDEFLDIVKNPPAELTNRYSFFSMLAKGASLEGYLFPDTYFFSRKMNTEDIAKRILANFDNKLTPDLREEIKKQGKTLEDVIAMASIIEREVNSEEDRKMVSGIFWNRIKNKQPLQSCATISYVLGVNKKQYSFEDTRIQSLYNTYINKGLPPGPISNPGIFSIKAAVYPEETSYNYFLSDPETGKTIFSRTIEEHNANKLKFGL
ncbi:MAG: endolytic transglycosylase MltG [bacterium]|nr:endolytic transglycosylase MltG [bacterium]